MMSLRLLCLVGLVAGIHCGLVRRDLGHKGGNQYGPPPSSGYGALPPASTYGAAPAPTYGAAPVSSYVASSYGAPVYYEEDDKPDLKTKLEEFKSKIIGHLGYMKGSILAAKGKMMLKKAQHYQQKGEKLVGIGESLKALKPEKQEKQEKHKHYEPIYTPPAPAYSAPAPAYSAPAPVYSAPASGYSG